MRISFNDNLGGGGERETERENEKRSFVKLLIVHEEYFTTWSPQNYAQNSKVVPLVAIASDGRFGKLKTTRMRLLASERTVPWLPQNCMQSRVGDIARHQRDRDPLNE